MMLCNMLLARRTALHSYRGIELGAGVGMCSILAVKLGIPVMCLTDKDSDVLELLRLNVEENGISQPDTCTVKQLEWGLQHDLDDVLGQVHDRKDRQSQAPASLLLLGSDVLYVSRMVKPLLQSVVALLHSGGRDGDGGGDGGGDSGISSDGGGLGGLGGGSGSGSGGDGRSKGSEGAAGGRGRAVPARAATGVFLLAHELRFSISLGEDGSVQTADTDEVLDLFLASCGTLRDEWMLMLTPNAGTRRVRLRPPTDLTAICHLTHDHDARLRPHPPPAPDEAGLHCKLLKESASGLADALQDTRAAAAVAVTALTRLYAVSFCRGSLEEWRRD